MYLTGYIHEIIISNFISKFLEVPDSSEFLCVRYTLLLVFVGGDDVVLGW